jgi:putative endopeptidase
MDQIYVAAYCTPELKANIRVLIDEVIDYYREMILSVNWLSENARNATVDKLDNMLIRCVYPDEFVDYTALNFKGCRNNEGGTLPEAVAAIKLFHRNRSIAKIGQNIVRGEWDMSAPYMTTTQCNAFYMPSENSINMMAGYLTEVIYTPDLPYEQLLAYVGTTIGHEITHAFDTTGYKFDKEGRLNPWWSLDDVEAFDYRASDLIKYYNSICSYGNSFVFQKRFVCICFCLADILHSVSAF